MSKKESFRNSVELAAKTALTMPPKDLVKLFYALAELSTTAEMRRDAGRIAFSLPEFEKEKLDFAARCLVKNAYLR